MSTRKKPPSVQPLRKPFFIDCVLDKFQLCSAVGCGSDACTEYQAEISHAAQIFIAACDIHAKEMKELAKQLSEGVSLRVLARKKRIDPDEIFIRPASYTQKCRLRQWESYCKSIAPNATDSDTHTQRHNRSRVVEAPKHWSWPLNRDRWRTTEGDMIALSLLRLAELLSAVRQIVDANFTIIPQTLSWTKQLTPPAIVYVYPEEELDVGPKVARDKLEDMRAEADTRGLLK